MDDADRHARAALEAFLPLPRDVRHAIAPKRSALLARLLPPAEMPDDERWDADLGAALLTWSIAGSVTTWCDAQLVGTFSERDGTFLWGDRNPSVPSAGTERLARAIDAMDDLAALRGVPRFAAPLEDVSAVAEWLAIRAGFLGVYPAPVGDATALIAVTPRLRPEWPADHPENVWCAVCGRTRFHVQALIAGAHGHLCSECVNHLLELREFSPPLAAGDADEEQMPELPPCLLSGSYGPRLFTPYTAVGYDALATCASILGGSPESGSS